uniref:Rac GTPase-activating protein 1-like n=1 Tax=Dermatophagoides pteronyssinus TaxID=6956 RepID=A0A6P6Y3T3_DERPT|nr:rac GTPase-activating protein 1-like [Dermatophagoides pteronyssinus]
MYYPSYHSSIRVRCNQRKPVAIFHSNPIIEQSSLPSSSSSIIEMSSKNLTKRSVPKQLPPPLPPSAIKLSPMTMYDDMTRYSNSANLVDFNELNKIITLVKNFEECRKNWAESLDTIRERDKTIGKQREEIHRLNIRLESLKRTLTNELKAKDELQKEFNVMKKTLNLLRSLVDDQQQKDVVNVDNQTSTSMNDRFASIKIDNIEEQSSSGNDTDTDSILFDKSDDGLESTQIQTKNHFEPIIEVNDDMENETKQPKSLKSKFTVMKIRSTSETPDNHRLQLGQQHRPQPMPRKVNLIRNQSTKLEPDRLDSRPHRFSERKAFKTLPCTVCSIPIGFYSTYSYCSDCHAIVHINCRDCLTRPCLQYMAPNPSIRKMLSFSGDKISNGGKFLIIGDFVPDQIRPCIPAILIHCCNEIDRRLRQAMKDSTMTNATNDLESPLAGLYRISAIDQDVRELRNRILRAEHGLPNLDRIESIHIICGVVKMFLRDLEDSLVSKIMWHNFVRASNPINETIPKQLDGGDKPDSGVDDNISDQTKSDNDYDNTSMMNDNQRFLLLKKVICELPLPHRDSLAFLIRHLNFVANCERITLMNRNALASIFAPTIIGNSEFCPQSSIELKREIPKQIMVMTALFEIEDQFWQQLLTDNNFSIQSSFKRVAKKKSSTIDTLADQQQQQQQLAKKSQTIKPIKSTKIKRHNSFVENIRKTFY